MKIDIVKPAIMHKNTLKKLIKMNERSIESAIKPIKNYAQYLREYGLNG